ncbi:MAG: tyrosine-protein phosphatase [Dermatophilaceae bacterium]
MHDIRWIDLDGCVNMRDVGGIPTLDGGRIAPNRLIRSDNLQDLSVTDVRHLVDEVGVTDVVDLRSFVELAREGDGPLAACSQVRIHHFTLYAADSHEPGIPAGERELPWAKGRDDATTPPTPPADLDHNAHWAGHYLNYLDERPDSIVAALRAIAGAKGAVIVHCAAGKDRTGALVGLALTAVGAVPAAIMADFAASAERVPLILERLMRRAAYADTIIGKTVDEQSPRAETMARLLGTLDTRHGGVLGWLATQGWTDADTQRLRAKLRE